MSQHRLCRVQLVNWGTFDGSRSFNVPRRGLLLTGPSGAGKSSILDAMASLLVRPGKLKFNAAAQGTETGDRERSLVTYVLGAFKRETDAVTGEVGTAFLRKGPTWSGVALTFDDGRGTATTLIRLFHLRAGTTSATDLRSMYVMAPEAVDLLTLQPYARDGIENRRVQQAFARWDCFSSDGYTGFSAKFRRRLGLGSEQAQLLLHKTQSAKNLTNLDSLFRDFMLDEPDTFDLAKDTVEQFDELTLAHAAVVDARHQVEVLLPLRALGDHHEDAETQLARLGEEDQHLEAWATARKLSVAEAAVALQRSGLARMTGELGRAVAELAEAEAARLEAQRALDGSAGAELATLEELHQTIQLRLSQTERRAETLQDVAAKVGLTWPGSLDEIGLFQALLRDLGDRFEEEQREHRLELHATLERQRKARDRLHSVDGDLEALRLHHSNLDARLLQARQVLIERLQVADSTLPFAGELLQVRDEEGHWTGAIERVLGSFARMLLVPDAHYRAASEVIDSHFFGVRLVYERVVDLKDPGSDEALARSSLVHKLELAEGPHKGWVAERLRRRFDYACVDDPREFRDHDRAVTRAGQVKHSASRHEKDDRRRIDDRSQWVLGFSTEDKEAVLVLNRSTAQAELIDAERELTAIDETAGRWQVQRTALSELEHINWQELESSSLSKQLGETQRKLDQLRAEHHDLPHMELALAKAESRVDGAEVVRRALTTRRDKASESVSQLEERIEAWQADLTIMDPVPQTVADLLRSRASELDVSDERVELELRKQLAEQTRRAVQRRGELAAQLTKQMGRYEKEWPTQSADWADEVEYLPEYLERLSTLERDGLPTFEQRFYELLQSQTNRNIGQLALKIKSARREIRTRVDDVNKSLRLTEFAPGGHLQIDVRDRGLDEVDHFLAALNEITSGSMTDVLVSDNPEDRATAERRFTLMKGILDRLGSSDPADRSWRERCLDTRQHVQFQARVQDDAGTQLDVFTGSGGRSGGERQKLVTFCLAAALRFQLAPVGQTEPTYALVVIDEAFDKADHEFTRAGLEVFKKFGFQLLLATPMKMLQTIDDYVGGVVMVTNDSGRRSQVQELPFETAEDADEGDSPVLQESLL